MNITEYCDVLNIELKITYYPNQAGRWSADIAHCEIKEGSFLKSSYENGTCPSSAIFNLCEKLRGNTIVLHARNKEMRREYVVPKISAE